MSIRSKLLSLHWLLSAQFGIDLIKTLRSLRGIAKYLRDLYLFRSGYTGRLTILPCLHDWHEEGGSTKNEYFWQDLLVAKKIFTANPKKHVDIGSRVDGFVAHVASFRDIEVLDIRPITTNIPGVTFNQADLMNPATVTANYCDSLSCLHALEHFGLGRYGDPIDPRGYESGIRNMARILSPEGILYLSVPVGIARVEFNAQHVFAPNTIVAIAEDNQLLLQEFSSFTAEDGFIKTDSTYETLSSIGKKHYRLGLFIFKKK